jgi:hydroxymethylpyrimidine/phosphomethylpyrimidine kinase
MYQYGVYPSTVCIRDKSSFGGLCTGVAESCYEGKIEQFTDQTGDMAGNYILKCACTVAGSDSGGGAGIQADIKTFCTAGLYGVSVLTAVTAQNTGRVLGVWTVPPEMVQLQMEAVTSEFPVGCIKSGMLGSADIIRALSGCLPEGVPYVLDPVMISTSGCDLLAEYAVQDLIRLLIPRATVITPNIFEAQVLSGMEKITDLDRAREAGRRILGMGPEYVVIKGGHLDGDEAVDILMGHGTEWICRGRRYPWDVHGSGCCFSAALTAFIASGNEVPVAFRMAKEFTAKAIEGAYISTSGLRIVNPDAAREK